MSWFAKAKIVASFGTSPGPASGITYSIRYNDPETGTPITVGPLRPWNPIERDPSGAEINVHALPVESPCIAMLVSDGLPIEFVALGPAEPREYFDCSFGGSGAGSLLDPTRRFGPNGQQLPPTPPPPGGTSGRQDAGDTGGISDGGVA